MSQQQPPEFFRKDFKMSRKLFCEKCKDITLHEIQVLVNSPKDNVVQCLRTCHICFEAYQKLEKLGLKPKRVVFYQRFYVTPYVFLVLHKGYID